MAREIRLSAPWPIPTLWEAGMGEMNYVKIFKHMTKRMREGGRDFTFGMKHQWKPDKVGERACIESFVAIDAAL